MNIMTKRGSQDNVVTYEHYCDTKDDLTAIPNDQITLGSTAVVLKDEGDAMGVYMANSSKEWIPFSNIGNTDNGSGGGSTGGIMVVQIDQTGTLNKTYQEIYDAFMNMNIVLINMSMAGQGFFTVIGETDDLELLTKTYDYENPTAIFSADSADEYPTLSKS